MVVGIVLVNTQPHSLVQKIHDRLPLLMPLLLILFFTLFGANLHISALPSLGLLGVMCVVMLRSAGKIIASSLAARFGKEGDQLLIP